MRYKKFQVRNLSKFRSRRFNKKFSKVKIFQIFNHNGGKNFPTRYSELSSLKFLRYSMRYKRVCSIVTK